MREKLNSNPLYQAALVGVLLLVGGFFILSTMGGGGAEEEEASTVSVTESVGVTTATGPGTLPAPGALDEAAPPPPAPVTGAFSAGKTVVLLFVRDGGIDDRMVRADVDRLESLSGVAAFVIPAHQIARYAAIAQGVNVKRVPALVVIAPKRLAHGTPTASVHYGYQSPETVVQAVVDAGYKGRTLGYHP
jgi:hypothetical protein